MLRKGYKSSIILIIILMFSIVLSVAHGIGAGSNYVNNRMFTHLVGRIEPISNHNVLHKKINIGNIKKYESGKHYSRRIIEIPNRSKKHKYNKRDSLGYRTDVPTKYSTLPRRNIAHKKIPIEKNVKYLGHKNKNVNEPNMNKTKVLSSTSQNTTSILIDLVYPRVPILRSAECHTSPFRCKRNEIVGWVRLVGNKPNDSINNTQNMTAETIGGCANLNKSDMYYVLDKDIRSDNGCIRINGLHNVIFDCKGHRIYANDPTNKNAFHIENSSHVTIKNCNIENLNGIVGEGSSNINISSNRITNFFNFGIEMQSSEIFTMDNNRMEKNISVGAINEHVHSMNIYLIHTKKGTITNNSLQGNTSVLIGIINSSEISVDRCELRDSEMGIISIQSNNMNITKNEILKNDVAINLEKTEGVNLINNIIRYNKNPDMMFIEQSTNMLIKSNIINNNKCGISIDSSKHIYVQFNKIYDNNHVNVWESGCYGGIHLKDSMYINVSSNNLAKNYYANIWMHNSNHNKVIHNIIKDAEGIGYSGLETSEAAYNEIAYNKVTGNRIALYFMHNSNHNKIHHNYVYHNFEDGIDFDHSEYNEIYNNVVQNTKVEGICFWSCGNNMVYNNIFNNTDNPWFDHDPGSVLYPNTWNVTKANFMGGNYWTRPSGHGFSDTCVDKNSDGICDSRYNLDLKGGELNVDYMPLSRVPDWMKNVTGLKNK